MWTLRQTPDGWEAVDDTGTVVASADDLVGLFEQVPAGQTFQFADDTAIVAAAEPDLMHWTGTIAMEDTPTGDGRMIAAGALDWETPFPLTWRREGGGHDDAIVIGTVWTVERDGSEIVGTGTFDLDAPATDEFPGGLGLEAARQVADGLTVDVSIEPDSVEAELRVRAEEVEEQAEAIEAIEDGEMPPPEDPEVDEDGRILLDDYRHDDWLEVVTAARIRTLTLVTTAAFDEATIDLVDGVDIDQLTALRNQPTDDEAEDAVAAALSVVTDPPAGWFDDPQLDGPTPVTVDDDGRVYGHLATWETCHVGRDDICLTPPPSGAGYAYFHTGAVHTDDGTVPTGVITMGTGHASLSAGSRQAAAHYDDNGTAVADIVAGEDEHGIWVAGALRPGVSDEQIRALRGSPLSGDWRRIGGNLELVAALAVNVPGFPIARTAALTPKARSDGHDTLALVAAGVARPEPARLSGWVEGELVELDTTAVDRRLARIERALTPQIADQIRAEVHGG